MTVTVHSPDEMHQLAARVAGQCRAGDVLVLTGALGAGKTTFTQGLGRALGVREPITSPTFVISRVHRVVGGPGLVHVDAYRLGSVAELDDLDVDADLADCITVVEWGEGLADGLSPDRLHIRIDRGAADETRLVTLTGHGARWASVSMTDIEQASP